MKIITTQLLKAHIHPRCISRPVLQKEKKTFRVVENHCLQCVESIFVNLPQFAKSGLKESLNRFFLVFSLHLFGYFGPVSNFFVSVSPGGEHLGIFWVGTCRPRLQIGTPF